jgi:cytochrome oxidase Cu insertion factor (SCO1/SenC/PrrC family)
MNCFSFLLTLLCAVLFAADLSAQENQPTVKVGDAAPAFTLKDQNGKETSLKKLLTQKPAALVFYRSADW